MKRRLATTGVICLTALSIFAGVVKVGSASYSDAFPGNDSGGRNGYPTATPLFIGEAAKKPVSTNDWWSREIVQPHASDGVFNYPLGLSTKADGLVIINNMQGQSICAEIPLKVGVEGISSDTSVSDYSDWSVTFNWGDASQNMEATVMMGNPMVYFTKTAPGNVKVDYSFGSATVNGNIAYINGSYNQESYILYAPTGSTWAQQGNTLTSDLNGKNYWSAVMLNGNKNAADYVEKFRPYAFVFPKDTRAVYSYHSSEGRVETTFSVTPDVKEGNADKVLLGLLPHQWGNIHGAEPAYIDLDYSTVRGQLRMAAGNEFKTSLRFSGVLPNLPLIEGETDFSPDELKALARQKLNDNGLQDWTDSYNDGQLLNLFVQVAEACRAAGDTEGFQQAYDLVKQRLERWLTYNQGDVAFMFYYHKPWNSMLGYPAGHGQDTNINDHHFHWGYFIRAAAMIAQHDKQWTSQYGEMINLLIRDAASPDRNDTMFPYLRNFDPYAGHSWADGTASMGAGNNQESSSEAMNFNTAVILWGDVTGNTTLRDLGVYLYATEQSAIEEYWFDLHNRILPSDFGHALACRIFSNSYDFQNFWGGGAGGSYGIQVYPMNTGHFYLMNDESYARRLWKGMTDETGILANEKTPNVWYDTWVRYLSMFDAKKALQLYNDNKTTGNLGSKFGDSQAYTYSWLHSMSRLGKPKSDITANHPLAMAFDNYGRTTYVAQNNTDNELDVRFSDGQNITVPARSMATRSVGTSNPDQGGDVTDPDNPDNPDQPSTGDGCSFTGIDASEGKFLENYTLTCKTVDDNVVLTATFPGAYEGFDGPWLFNETDGFQEIRMQTIGEGAYTANIAGMSAGDTFKFRVKVAFSGGLAITKQYEYTVGQNCGGIDNSVSSINGDFKNIIVAPNPAKEYWRVMTADDDATILVYDPSGKLMGRHVTDCGDIQIPCSSYPPGIYIMHVRAKSINMTVRVVKN